MTTESLADLDELVIRCRTENSRTYLREAVACYRAGSIRAGIVAAWIAAVFDFVDKLEELETAGDANAKLQLERFDTICAQNDIKKSLEFERNVLDLAKDMFELISPMEYADLKRLFEDRNRCAHPSVNVRGSIYQPTAELLRTHIRNVATHLLARAPVQGKAALERVVREVEFETFPTEVALAVRHFQFGPVGRPRDSLIRNFLFVLLKRLLNEDLTGPVRARYLAAFAAIVQMHRRVAEAAMSEKLNDILRISDDQLPRCIYLLGATPETWDLIAPDVQARFRSYVQQIAPELAGELLPIALSITVLRPNAEARIAALDSSGMKHLTRFAIEPVVVDRCVDLYAGSESFNSANWRAENIILPIIPKLRKEHVEQIIKAIKQNAQVEASFRLSDVLWQILQQEPIPAIQFLKMLADANVHPAWEEPVVEVADSPDESDEIPF